MTCRPRWVRFDARKRPLRADGAGLASVTDPATWAPYSVAVESAAGEGVGFVLGEGIGCLDLDDAIDEHGELADWARLLIAQHRAEALFVEVSRSGRGVHIFLPLDEGPGRRIREGAVKLETYSRARYIAVTGKALEPSS